MGWIDEHVERTGDVEVVRARPWATVLRAPTASGPVWMKVAGRDTAFEVPLYGLLARRVPERVLIPIAADVERGWLLLPDGGPHAGLDALPAALAAYGRLQRELADDVEELLALVPLGMLLRHRGADAMERARDAYLEGFGGRELAETLELACRVAKIARTLTWVRAAPEEDAAGQQLATLLEESFV